VNDIAVCYSLLEIMLQITTRQIPAAMGQNTCASLRSAQYFTPINTKLLLFTTTITIIFKISWFERLFYTSSNSGEKWKNFWTQELIIFLI